MTALRKLIDAVEAGSHEGGRTPFLPYPYSKGSTVMLAYCGSLNAAKALHEALLPGFSAGIGFNPQKEGSVAIVFKTDERGMCNLDHPTYESEARPEARAWLIAILKAYEART